MPSLEKIYNEIMQGKRDHNIKFRDMQRLLNALGFENRIHGDHFVYSKKEYFRNINIQTDGNLVKSYQVKQVRKYFNQFNVKLGKWEGGKTQ